MKLFLTFALAAALCAPAFAQKSGSINSNAPTLTQTCMAGDAKITLNYTSIHFGQGRMFEMATDKEKGERARKRINDGAKSSPIGDFSTSVDLTCGAMTIPAGDYKVGFTINDKLEWEINFMGKETHTMKLDLMDSPEGHKRLLMCLYAGDEAGAGVYVAFGSKFGFVTLAPAGEKKG